MPTDQNAACENINRMFFTTVSTKQRKEQLVFDLDAARRRVILLQDELDTLEKMGDVRNLTSSMLEELERLFPWLHVTTCTETNELVIYTVRQPLLFHGNRNVSGTSGNDLVKNREIIYMTLPVYEFEARLQRNGGIRMQQCSAYVMKNGEERLRKEQVGHPHAINDRQGWFSSVCQGNNDFMRLYDEGCRGRMMPETLILVIRKICLWFLEANLSDMYGTSPCGIVNLPDSMTFFHTRTCFDMSSELLAILQERVGVHAVMDRLHERVIAFSDNVGKDVQDNFLDPLRLYCTAANTAEAGPETALARYMDAYAFLWASVLHSWASSRGVSNAFIRDCLMHAMRNDIRLLKDTTEAAAPCIYRPWMSPATMLAAPSALLDYGLAWGIGGESMSALRRYLDPGHEWIEARLHEWDTAFGNSVGTGMPADTDEGNRDEEENRDEER